MEEGECNERFFYIQINITKNFYGVGILADGYSIHCIEIPILVL